MSHNKENKVLKTVQSQWAPKELFILLIGKSLKLEYLFLFPGGGGWKIIQCIRSKQINVTVLSILDNSLVASHKLECKASPQDHAPVTFGVYQQPNRKVQKYIRHENQLKQNSNVSQRLNK